jgi:hypothetical protein
LAGFHISYAETEGEGYADESEDFTPCKGLAPRGHRTKVDVIFDPKEPHWTDVARTCDDQSHVYTLYQDKGQKPTYFLIYINQKKTHTHSKICDLQQAAAIMISALQWHHGTFLQLWENPVCI